MPQNCTERPSSAAVVPPKPGQKSLLEVIPVDENKPFDIMTVIDHIIDEGSFVEIKKLYAKEVVTGFARVEGRVIGIVANQPKHKGGVLFVDSADKAARFIWLCDAFNIPLLYLADVPGFMIGTVVEKQGIIRAGAKMIAAVSEATVPKLSVIVRKAYGAGLYAMCGPAFEPDACIALPTASIAVMGPSAAVNAVFFNKIQAVPEGPERDAHVQKLRDEYREDIDLVKLASELVVDAVIPAETLRSEVARRFARHADKHEVRPRKHHMVPPM
jgi:methylmalonyl-CoA decarboxylase subunit alpha